MPHQPDETDHFDAVLAARPHDATIRWTVNPSTIVDSAIHGDQVAYVRSTSSGEHWVYAKGDDATVLAALVSQLLLRTPIVNGITVPAAIRDDFPEPLRLVDSEDWCVFAMDRASIAARIDDLRSLAAGTVDLASDDPRIDELLAHSPSAHEHAGSTRVLRWVGVVYGERLLSVAAQVRNASGASFMVSVCTAPDARGRGLAAKPCARIVVDAHESGAPAAALEMYSANDSGRRLYTRMGFEEVAAYSSGAVPGVPSQP